MSDTMQMSARHVVECCVAGSCIYEGPPAVEILRAEGITPSSVEDHSAALVLKYCIDKDAQGLPWDIALIGSETEIPMDDLYKFVDHSLGLANMRAHTQRLKEIAAFDEASECAVRLSESLDASTPRGDGYDAIQRAYSRLEVLLGESTSAVTSAAEVDCDPTAQFEQARKGEYNGTRWRWDKFNQLLVCLKPRTLNVFAAQPSCGKTTIACDQIEHALSLGIPQAVATIEVSNADIMIKLAAIRAGVNLHELQSGEYSSTELNKFKVAYDQIKREPLYLMDNGSATIFDVLRFFESCGKNHGCKNYWLDYLTLLSETKDERSGNRSRSVGRWCQLLKAFAKKHDACVNVLSQLSRDMNNKSKETTPPLPTVQNLRDSGEIEQHADAVIMLSKLPGRPWSEFGLGKDWPMIVDIAKNRSGPVGMLSFIFVQRLQLFVHESKYAAYKGDF